MKTTSHFKQSVLLDVDGLIADFTTPYLMCVRMATGRHIPDDWEASTWDVAEDLGLSEQEQKDADMLMAAPNMAYLFNPLPGAVEGVNRLIAVADVCFVTAPFRLSPTWVFDRSRWLEKFFGEHGKKVVPTHEKHRVYGDIFVDDKPANVREFKKAWPTSSALYWSTQRTRQPDLVNVSSWQSILLEVQIRSNAQVPKGHPRKA